MRTSNPFKPAEKPIEPVPAKVKVEEAKPSFTQYNIPKQKKSKNTKPFVEAGGQMYKKTP